MSTAIKEINDIFGFELEEPSQNSIRDLNESSSMFHKETMDKCNELQKLVDELMREKKERDEREQKERDEREQKEREQKEREELEQKLKQQLEQEEDDEKKEAVEPVYNSIHMPHQNILKNFDDLYDGVRGDNDNFMNEDEFNIEVQYLINDGYIRTGVVNDNTIYSARDGLKWENIVNTVNSIQQSIMLLLINNPTTFFVLQNTQKGKMRIASLELKTWGQDTTQRVVAFIIVDNDLSLSDQSQKGIHNAFEDQKYKRFVLSSSPPKNKNENNPTLEGILDYIDAYANLEYNDRPMPVIILLCNNIQCKKMLAIIKHIDDKVARGNSALRYGLLWDEADKTYAQLRAVPFIINGTTVSCKTYTVEKTQALYRLGFVSATDGNLLDDNYPESANAYLYPYEFSPEDTANYRALHHMESKTHRVEYTSKHNHNSYAMHVLKDNYDHFMTPITLPSGEIYFRKIIINSNSKTADMRTLAKECNKQGMHALIFNGFNGLSVKVHRVGHYVEQTHKTNGLPLNELLFYIYKQLNLNDRPLIIIGRRKVERGLGFHYSPRNNESVQIKGDLGVYNTTPMEGLIWSDIILGKITDKDSGSQKAGRGAGIIANSPQYSGATHYWTDKETEELIRNHNTVVDRSNTMKGCSVGHAVKRARLMSATISIDDVKKRKAAEKAEAIRKKARTPIITINISEEEMRHFGNDAKILAILRMHNEDAYNMYNNYKLRCWRMDSDDKCNKWGLRTMCTPNAYSSDTNIIDKKDNVMMIYLYHDVSINQNMLIINVWKGEETRNL